MTELELKEMIGRSLKEILEESRMSQKELAEETDISEATISHYINAERMPSIKNLINIANALDSELSEFIDADEKII